MQDVATSAKSGNDTIDDAFSKSEWFTRGWTLQELLAEGVKVFCNSSWHVIGHIFRGNKRSTRWWKAARPVRTEPLGAVWLGPTFPEERPGRYIYYREDLSQAVSQITSVDLTYLNGSVALDEASVACRFSWAASRETTREEDQAYCLLGLFGVNMPLLYGEGSKAFLRLQQEIIKVSCDESIFAWTAERDRWNGDSTEHGIMAKNLRHFKNSAHVCRTGLRPDRPYSITNIGLEMNVKRYKLDLKDRRYVDDLCEPYLIPLISITTYTQSKVSMSLPGKPAFLVLLDCLHDRQHVYYRSRCTDYLMRAGRQHKSELPLRGNSMHQIFVPLIAEAAFHCEKCQKFDARLEIALQFWDR